MRIFFFTSAFFPSVGGHERVAEVLCTQFVRLGHEVRLATETSGERNSHFSFSVIRKPNPRELLSLSRWCDVHIQTNVSLRYGYLMLLCRNRSVYRHGNVYQRDDGTLSLRDRCKRFVARHTPGIANSRYTAAKLKCKYTIFNPYEHEIFRATQAYADRPGQLIFLGRLVSQKGCDVLFHALRILAARGERPRLTVIGDGPERAALEALAQELAIAHQVAFLGTLTGHNLARELNRHRILVVPSRYEEPFGIVALEGLACGCLPIVAERGGLVDAIGSHGLSFPNGDPIALANCLGNALSNPRLAHDRLNSVSSHLEQFRAPAVADRYLDVFDNERKAARASRSPIGRRLI